MKLLIASIVIFIIGFFGLLSPLQNGLSIISTPVQSSLSNSAQSIKNVYVFFVGVREVSKDNENLRLENQALKDSVVQYKIAGEENALLRQQLEVKEEFPEDQTFVLANVLGNPADKTGSSIVIDKGTRDGIKQGNNVVVGKSIVGIVRTAEIGRSVVDLITSPNVSITAMDIDSPNKAEGLVTGQFGTSIELTRILPSDILEVGDTIITTGKDGSFEPNLIVGTVTEIQGTAADALRTAFIESQVDLNKLTKVFVLTF